MREQVERLIAITLLGKNVFPNSQKMSNSFSFFFFLNKKESSSFLQNGECFSEKQWQRDLGVKWFDI